MTSIFRSAVKHFLQPNLSTGSIVPTRSTWKIPYSPPRKRNPVWFVRKTRTIHEDDITPENREFIQEVIHDEYGPPSIVKGVQSYANANKQSLIKQEDFNLGEWKLGTRRTGVIAKKIGVVPMWKKDGKQILTTMLQVEDNHVIRYIPPEEYTPMQIPAKKIKAELMKRYGCLMIGAGSTDPSLLTKEYSNMFTKHGIMPKKYLGRFLIKPEAALPSGTPLNVTHYRVGDYVDVRGKTIDRGFQGVMKRWGFKGMPATHGVTKTHRRGGNIGSGGQKARVWPGTKMPGHMGNRYRINRGLKIWRINTVHNVMWVSGVAIPGETNSICYIYDTILPLKRFQDAPPFPTCLTEPDPNVTDIWADDIHNFEDPTIVFEPEEITKK